MITYIPEPLIAAGFRFIKIRPRSKLPHEKDWPTIFNYHGHDPALLSWLRRDHSFEVHDKHYEGRGNYALLGDEEHVIVDLDAPTIIDAAARAMEEGLLPATRRVQSGSGKGAHLIYKTAGARTVVLNDPGTDENLGHIKGPGGYCVGEGSTHPSGRPYTVLDDLPVARVSFSVLLQVFSPWIKTNPYRRVKRPSGSPSALLSGTITDQLGLRIENEAMPLKAVKTSSGWQGTCPWHGSAGGMNFGIDTAKNQWFCHRHGVGGDPFSAIAVREGFCDEEQAAHLRDRPEVVRQVIEYLREHGHGERLATLEARNTEIRKKITDENRAVFKRLGI